MHVIEQFLVRGKGYWTIHLSKLDNFIFFKIMPFSYCFIVTVTTGGKL